MGIAASFCIRYIPLELIPLSLSLSLSLLFFLFLFFAESVVTHIKSGDGIGSIIPFLEHPEVEHRIYAFRLTRILSATFGDDLANELNLADKLPLFKDKLLDNQSTDGERSDAACILANLPLSEDDVKSVLGSSFVRWTVVTLKDRLRGSANWRTSRSSSFLEEGLLGLLLHFTQNPDPQTVSIVKEHSLMNIFCEMLNFHMKSRVKQLAALGLKNLSDSRKTIISSGDLEVQLPRGLCSSFVFNCWKRPPELLVCAIHNVSCEEDIQFCLLRSNCIKPLVDLLKDEDTNVQIAAVEALSTLIIDSSNNNFKKSVDELEHQGVIEGAITLFTEVRPGILQERLLWMIERILRVESNVKHSLNQSLVRALVEAFRHGNANAKRHSQDALTNLKQLSGTSGKNSSQSRPRR